MSILIEPITFESFRSGNEQSLYKIVNQNYPKVFAFINKMIKSEPDAEELTHDVFLKLWEKRASVNSIDTFSGFVFTIARNKVYDFLRKENMQTVELEESSLPDDMIIDPNISEADIAEIMILVDMEVSKMPAQRQRIYRMRRKDDLSIDEIAEELGLTKKNVKQLLYLAESHLRKTLFPFLIIIPIVSIFFAMM